MEKVRWGLLGGMGWGSREDKTHNSVVEGSTSPTEKGGSQSICYAPRTFTCWSNGDIEHLCVAILTIVPFLVSFSVSSVESLGSASTL